MALSYTSKYKPDTIFLLIGSNMNELHHYPGKEWLHPLFHISKYVKDVFITKFGLTLMK